MLEIILFILKLLGILLMVILGIVFLVLALILFAPVKYSGKGSKYGDELKIQALVTYLNPIVRVCVQYPGKQIVQVKIFGFTVFKAGKATEEEEQFENTKENPKEEKTKPSYENNTSAEQECQHQGIKESSQGKEEGSPQQSSSAAAAEQSLSADINAEESSEPEITEQPVSESFNTGSSETKAQQDNPKDSILDTVGYYASLFQENKGLVLEVMKTVIKALKTILPRKCRIKAILGTGEADKTGFIYAAYCAMEGYLPGEIIFEPVWTEKFAEGEFELKGKIRLIHFLVAAIKIIANKNVRLLIKKIRRV